MEPPFLGKPDVTWPGCCPAYIWAGCCPAYIWAGCCPAYTWPEELLKRDPAHVHVHNTVPRNISVLLEAYAYQARSSHTKQKYEQGSLLRRIYKMMHISFATIFSFVATVALSSIVSGMEVPVNVLFVLPSPPSQQQQLQQRQILSTSPSLLHDVRVLLVGAARAVRGGDDDPKRWSREAVPASPGARLLLLSPTEPKGLRSALRRHLVDAVLCPTRACARAVTTLRDEEASARLETSRGSSGASGSPPFAPVQVVYLGFSSILRGDVHGSSVGWAAPLSAPPLIAQDLPVRQVIHVAGRSTTRHTAEVLKAWLLHPEWPNLIIVTEAQHNWPFRQGLLHEGLLTQLGTSGAGNILVKNVHISDEELDRLLTESAAHLVPSGIEGFGHALNEARALGAVLITTAYSPMNELVDETSGVLLHGSQLARWPPAQEDGLEYHFAQVSPSDVETGINEVLRVPPAGRAKLGAKARVHYEAERDAFFETLTTVLLGDTTASTASAKLSPVTSALIVTRTDPPFLVTLDSSPSGPVECEAGSAPGNFRRAGAVGTESQGDAGRTLSDISLAPILSRLTGTGSSPLPGDAALHSLRVLLASPAGDMYQQTFAGTPGLSTVVDVGAHLNGVVALFAATLGHRVTAVDTRPAKLHALREGVRANMLEDLVAVVQSEDAAGLEQQCDGGNAETSRGGATDTATTSEEQNAIFGRAVGDAVVAARALVVHIAGASGLAPLARLAEALTKSEAPPPCFLLVEHDDMSTGAAAVLHALVALGYDLHFQHDFEQVPAEHRWARDRHRPVLQSGATLAAAGHGLVFAQLPAGAPGSKAWRELEAAEHKVFSQNGEDGVLEALFAELGTTNRFYVEFGTWDGVELNTRALGERSTPPWHGLLMDDVYEDAGFGIKRETVTVDNLVSLLRKYEVPKEPDLFSIDTDCYDFWLFEAILASPEFSLRVFVLEVNAGLVPPLSVTIPHPKEPAAAGLASCQHTTWFGASVVAYHTLARAYGYSMVFCESQGVNCFFVRDDVLGFRASDFLSAAMLHRPPTYGTNCDGHRDDPRQLPFRAVSEHSVLKRKRDGIAFLPADPGGLVSSLLEPLSPHRYKEYRS
ncbi:hypothetical protein CYMTET_15694 [Cymbomonas tetramitiformis]|uniref:Glycosyl transferase family 1 domain-containing protein n=1 Tax=Cymbomonas tetramitiformis TaxID=36881 RepID=A0AAE0GDH4_9CHLO|nr:hypothetical protein CYMTET_15694 [Cymbomonas tetramitiformis]